VSGDYARWFACALFSAAAVTDCSTGIWRGVGSSESEIGRFLEPIGRQSCWFPQAVYAGPRSGALRTLRCCRQLVILCRESWSPDCANTLAGLRVGHAGVAPASGRRDPDGRYRVLIVGERDPDYCRFAADR